MSIFKNIFGNKNKEEKKGDEKVLFESNIKRDILNDLEADKVIAELENERKLKELENQIKLKELEIENKIKLNKKFSDDIKEVYINQSEYFSNMKIVFGRLKSYYNDFGIKITEDDIINIFVFIAEQTKNCTCLKDFDSKFGKVKLNLLYSDYFVKINYPNQVIEKDWMLYDHIRNHADGFAGNCLNGVYSLITSLIILDVNSYYTKNDLLKDLNKEYSWLSDGLRENNINLFYKLMYFADILGMIYSINRMLYLNDYLKDIERNEEFKTVFENYLIKGSADNEGLYTVYKEFYSNVFDSLLNLSDFNLLITMYRKYINNESWEESLQSIFDLLGIDCDKIINDYIDLNTNKNIYDYSTELLSSKTFETLIMYPKYEILASLYSEYILFKLIGKIDFEKWLLMLLEKNTFTEKVSVYNKKYELLNMDRKRIESIIKLNEMLSNVTSGEEFEIFLKHLYEIMGYIVELTPKTGDQGADLILQKNNKKIVAQAKFYSNPVGNFAIQEVVAATKYYNADKAIVVTNNVFTKPAKDLADANDVQLIDGNSLNACINMLV